MQKDPGGGGGHLITRGTGYVPLASQSPVIVYSVANYRLVKIYVNLLIQLGHFLVRQIPIKLKVLPKNFTLQKSGKCATPL